MMMNLDELEKLYGDRDNDPKAQQIARWWGAITQSFPDILARIRSLEQLFEDLTPGGSEFHGDAEKCCAFIKDRLVTNGKLAARNNALERDHKLMRETLAIYADPKNWVSDGGFDKDWWRGPTESDYAAVVALQKLEVKDE